MRKPSLFCLFESVLVDALKHVLFIKVVILTSYASTDIIRVVFKKPFYKRDEPLIILKSEKRILFTLELTLANNGPPSYGIESPWFIVIH